MSEALGRDRSDPAQVDPVSAVMTCVRGPRSEADEIERLTNRLLWVHVQLAVGVSIEISGAAVWMWMWMTVHEFSGLCAAVAFMGAVVIWHGAYRHARISKFLLDRMVV